MPLLFSHMHKHSTTACCSVLWWDLLTRYELWRTVRYYGRLWLPSNPSKYIMELFDRLLSILHPLSTTSFSLCEDFCDPCAATVTPFSQRPSTPYFSPIFIGRGGAGCSPHRHNLDSLPVPQDEIARLDLRRATAIQQLLQASRSKGGNVAQNKR